MQKSAWSSPLLLLRVHTCKGFPRFRDNQVQNEHYRQHANLMAAAVCLSSESALMTQATGGNQRVGSMLTVPITRLQCRSHKGPMQAVLQPKPRSQSAATFRTACSAGRLNLRAINEHRPPSGTYDVSPI